MKFCSACGGIWDADGCPLGHTSPADEGTREEAYERFCEYSDGMSEIDEYAEEPCDDG